MHVLDELADAHRRRVVGESDTVCGEAGEFLNQIGHGEEVVFDGEVEGVGRCEVDWDYRGTSVSRFRGLTIESDRSASCQHLRSVGGSRLIASGRRGWRIPVRASPKTRIVSENDPLYLCYGNDEVWPLATTYQALYFPCPHAVPLVVWMP